MRLAGHLLLACVVLAVLKALVAGLLLALGTTLLAGLIFQPAATVRAVGTIFAIMLFAGHPFGCLIAVATISALSLFVSWLVPQRAGTRP